MCHSARLAQRNLSAGQKKTTKGLSKKKSAAREGRNILEFLFLKFRSKSEYF